MKAVAGVLGVSRSSLRDRASKGAEPRRRCHKADHATGVPMITALVAARPTYGCRRIAALLSRQLQADRAAPVNHMA